MARSRLKSQKAVPSEKPTSRRQSNLERSAYFARREAAKVLRTVLQGDATRRASSSIKALIYSPNVRNKKGTYALVCQTLRHLPIKEVLEDAHVLNTKWKKQEPLMYLVTYDILFGKENSLVGDAEKFLMLRKDALQLSLARLLVKKKVKRIDDLVAVYGILPELSKPRYVRVNTLKLDVDAAFVELGRQYKVEKDDTVPELLILPSGSDLHDHPLVSNGSVFLQGKASSMVAAVLDPKPDWEVIDACSAPGNKTVHLAALMNGKGKIVACELNKDRVKRLEETVSLSGATNIEVLHGDFLNLNPKDPAYSKVRAILLDPSCSGSGTSADRLDHLLPSHSEGHASAGFANTERLNKLAAFQKKALAHALSCKYLSSVSSSCERVAYSTCSINQIENEDVVQSVVPLAESYGFQLATPFPNWQGRGLPVFDGAERLLRTDEKKDKEGFFIALFTRNPVIQAPPPPHADAAAEPKRKRVAMPLLHSRLSKMWFQLHRKTSTSTNTIV